MAPIMAQVITNLNLESSTSGVCFAQQYIYKHGLKKFKERGKEAAYKEIDQLIRRTCFAPIDVKNLTASEKERAQEGLMFLNKKETNQLKVDWCIMGS